MPRSTSSSQNKAQNPLKQQKSAYLVFYNEQRAKLISQKSKMKNQEMNDYIAKKWQKIEEQKKEKYKKQHNMQKEEKIEKIAKITQQNEKEKEEFIFHEQGEIPQEKIENNKKQQQQQFLVKNQGQSKKNEKILQQELKDQIKKALLKPKKTQKQNNNSSNNNINNNKQIINDDSESEQEEERYVKKVVRVKKEKNPNRQNSDYIAFFKENYRKLKARFPNRTSSELSKACSLEWKRVKLISRNSKIQSQIENRQKSGSEQVKRENNNNNKPKKIDKRMVTINGEQVLLPKNPIGCYMYFYKEYRGQMIEQNPEDKSTEIARKVAEEWKNISDQEKKKFIRMAEEDKLRYEQEKVEFSEKYNYRFKVPKKDQPKSVVSRPPREKKKVQAVQNSAKKSASKAREGILSILNEPVPLGFLS